MAKSEGELTWKDIEIGSIITEPGSTRQYKTGDWRSQRPTYNFKKCIKCGICYIFCPEGCISMNEDALPVADLDYCKGCGICQNECVTGCIRMEMEVE